MEIKKPAEADFFILTLNLTKTNSFYFAYTACRVCRLFLIV